MIVFNTGRWYTDNGQRIAADFTPEGGILFADVDRNIDGYIPPELVESHALRLIQRDVMFAYDHHEVFPYWHDVMRHAEQLRPLREAARAHPAPARS